jgi:hypothetical protein
MISPSSGDRKAIGANSKASTVSRAVAKLRIDAELGEDSGA